MSQIKRVLAIMAMTLVCWNISIDLSAQCDARVLACNNLVHVSLDTNCVAVIGPDVILKNPDANDSLYRVEVFAPDGTVFFYDLSGSQPSGVPRVDTIREDFGGVLLETRVYCLASGIYCWGNVKIEDKIKPTLTVEPIDTAVSCFVYPFDLDPNNLVTRVSFSDNGCEKPDSLGIVDFQETIFPCADTIKIIRRIWSVVDAAGNRCDTTQNIFILKGDISELTYPQDTTVDCLDEADLSVDKLGMPDPKECDHFEITYEDVEIPVCGEAKKILRRWRVTDICNSDDTLVTQVIKIEDNFPPMMDFSEFEIPEGRLVAQKFNCLADAVDIPNPIVTDCNLAQTTLTAGYQLTDNNGNPAGTIFPAVVNDLETFNLTNVPIGVDFVVIFTANDGCGNISRDTSGIVRAVDTQAPNAVCEGFTTVVLNDEGEAEVFASTFDDHSFDNCGIVNKLARRFDSSNFQDRLLFTCDDVAASPIRVVFRVFDAAGLTSDCIVNVIVQDKRPISLTCDGDKVFNCDITREEVDSILRMEEPIITESCGITELTLDIPDYQLSNCGEATFVVTWNATDANGLTSSCTRNVSITNLVAATVRRPSRPTFDVFSCAASIDPDSIPNSQPTVLNVDCEEINISHEDADPLFGEADACVKVIRTWTIIDWCRFNGGDVSSAIIDQFDQTIRISDTQEPVFTTECVDMIIADNDKDCEEAIALIVNATDDCATAEEITYTYTIDRNRDGTIDYTGASNDASGTYQVGDYRVVFTAMDACGNTAECAFDFQIRSTKEPVVFLLTNVEVVLDANGESTLNASQTDASSSNGCVRDGVISDGTGLIFSFSESGDEPSRTFTCADVPNGRGALIPTRIWVLDSLGNKESQIVNITVSDNLNDACTDIQAVARISGQITDEELSPIENIPVVAIQKSSGQAQTVLTDEYGLYEFEEAMEFEDYTIQPSFDDYPLAGISTIDILLIQRHILGISRLDSPYKLLAADVNNSKTISASDLLEIRKLLLGTTEEFNDQHWKFVDEKFEFNMDGDIYTFEDVIEINGSNEVEADHNFIGMKVGDVNGNASEVIAQGYTGPRSVEVMDVNAERHGDLVRYTFSARSMQTLLGMQMGIHIEEGMELKALGSNTISLDEDHFSVSDYELRISWTADQVIDADDKDLFFIDLQIAGEEIPMLELNRSDLPGEVYDADLETSQLVLELESRVVVEEEFAVMQNHPNPFSDQTSIEFQLPTSSKVNLQVTDMSGRVVYTQSGYYHAGKNIIQLSNSDMNASGVMYYTLLTDTNKETRRMIVLQ